jgi:hypothetical protein
MLVEQVPTQLFFSSVFLFIFLDVYYILHYLSFLFIQFYAFPAV